MPLITLGPYFFENEAGAAVSVNGSRYETMINKFLWPELIWMWTTFISNKAAQRPTQW